MLLAIWSCGTSPSRMSEWTADDHNIQNKMPQIRHYQASVSKATDTHLLTFLESGYSSFGLCFYKKDKQVHFAEDTKKVYNRLDYLVKLKNKNSTQYQDLINAHSITLAKSLWSIHLPASSLNKNCQPTHQAQQTRISNKWRWQFTMVKHLRMT